MPDSGGLQAKVRLYADDTTLLLKDFRSPANLLELIVLFERGTGAKHNNSKTRAIMAWGVEILERGASSTYLGSQDYDSERCFWSG